ncbi:MAG: hypothetical protein FWE62_05375 [Firmicutes bacterium]|nr:hypothetical protein [Bacillota bacterium]
MKFGLAKEIITPCFKTRIACSGEFDAHYQSVHDDLYVRMLVMDDGRNKTLLAAFDLLFHSPDLNDAVAAYARDAYGICPELCVTGYTHAHTAPAVRGYNPGAETEAYEFFLLERAKACLDKAMNSMSDGTLEYGSYCADFNISRRKKTDEGFRLAPASGRERDTETAVLAVKDSAGAVRGIVVCYACHPVFYPAKTILSAEFPGRVTALLDAKYYGSTSLYFQSAGGDVRPADTVVNGTFGPAFDFSAIDRFAAKIADSVSAFIDGEKTEPLPLCLRGAAGVIRLPVEPKPRAYFEAESARRKNGPDPNARNAEILANEYGTKESEVGLRTNLIRLGGNVCIAAMGGEPCFGVKRIVRDTLPDYRVIFIGYTDSCAYIVSDAERSEGGYEAECHLEYGHLGPFCPGTDSLYREAFKAYGRRIKDLIPPD